MTWQRIDENTYIDDTLVTCAEYQLFIDEMRDQGKYYQPDHWIGFRFPDGKAREPILGVRQADAVMFCEWLTNREAGEWKYRLPTQQEADTFHLKLIGTDWLGYWIESNQYAKYQFAWITRSSSLSIPLDYSRNFRRAGELYVEINDFVMVLPADIDHNRLSALENRIYEFPDIMKSSRDIDRDDKILSEIKTEVQHFFELATSDNRSFFRRAYDLIEDIELDMGIIQTRREEILPPEEGIRLVKAIKRPEDEIVYITEEFFRQPFQPQEPL